MPVPYRRTLLYTLPFALLASAGLHAAPLDYTACTDNILPGSLCAMHAVPASHEAQGQGAETLELFVRKIPAQGRSKGSVWLVAGGPGESGASFYSLLPTLRRSFAGFDLLIPDHRGTGYSSRLCPAEEAAGSPGGMALAGAEWASCFKDLNTAPARARQFSISNAAQDLRSLVGTTQGNGAVYLYGVSYGTQLVLRSLQLGPLPVRGVILDSLVPPQSDPRWDLSQRSQVVNQVGLQVLAQCDADAACHAMLGEPAQTLYRRVLDKLRQEPALLATIPGKNLKHFIGGMLDVPAARARIPALLQDLDHGGGTELAAVRGLLNQAASSLGSYPQSSISIPLVSMISNSENNLRPGLTTADVDREEATLLMTSPLPRILLGGGLPTYFQDRYFGQLPASLPPVLVLQGTLDPKTPYAGAQAQVAALRQASAGRAGASKVTLATIGQAPHFILWAAPACFERSVQRFIAAKPVEDCALTLKER